MSIGSKSRNYGLAIDAVIRKGDEICHLLDGKASTFRQMETELEHLRSDFQNGRLIGDISDQTFHQKLQYSDQNAKKLDQGIGLLAKKTLKEFSEVHLLIYRPTITPKMYLGLFELGFDICLVSKCEEVLRECQKIVKTHQKYLESRVSFYDACKMAYQAKLFELQKIDPAKDKEGYFQWLFSSVSFGLKQPEEPSSPSIVLTNSTAGWVKSFWERSANDMPLLSGDALIQNLPYLLVQKPYNPPKRPSSLTSGMNLRPRIKSENLRREIDDISTKTESGIKPSTYFAKAYEERPLQLDSLPMHTEDPSSRSFISFLEASDHIHSSEISKSSFLDPPAILLEDVPANEDSVDKSVDFASEPTLTHFEEIEHSKSTILTETAFIFYQSTQELIKAAKETESYFLKIFQYFDQLVEKQNVFLNQISIPKKANNPNEEIEKNIASFASFLEEGVHIYVNFLHTTRVLESGHKYVSHILSTIVSWELTESLGETLEGCRFSTEPLKQLKTQIIQTASFLRDYENNKSLIVNNLTKLKHRLNNGLYNLKWARGELGFMERGSSYFKLDYHYLNAAVEKLKRNNPEKDPSCLILEDPFLDF